jgi:D-3-phosphoglycerate dehydrogenase
VRDFLAEGILRNAVNLPPLSAEQYRRLRPYLDLAERLGSMAAQVAEGWPSKLRITYAGEPAELGTNTLRSAVLAGLLNTVLSEKVNLVNAGTVAASRGLVVEEHMRRRDYGFPHTIEVAALCDPAGTCARSISLEGTVLHGTLPRLLNIDGIALEAPLEGTLLYLRNRDEPGVIGQIGTILGSSGVNIATFALGRREATRGAEAVSLVRLDGEVSEAMVLPIRKIPAITESKLVRLKSP